MIVLNDLQKEAVHHVDGPCLVTSCPGSGKTRVLVERAINLIDEGVNSKNILCLTFTNKAGNEMKQRIMKRLDVNKLDFFIGTFHSLCAKILRNFGNYINYSKNFTIIDSGEQIDYILKIARQEEVKIERPDVKRIAYAVNTFRDKMENFEWVENYLNDSNFSTIADKYLKKCKEHDLVDFSALISETIKLLEEHNDVKEVLQERFKYIMVDETQDTNQSQFHLVNLFAEKYKNIMLIGDLNQCLTDGTEVLIKDGYKNIESIEQNDSVKATNFFRDNYEINTSYSKVLNKYRKKYNGKIINIITESGKSIKSTPEHLFFSDINILERNKYYVNLVYKKETGYRLNINNGSKIDNDKNIFDRIWILKICNTIEDAMYFIEKYYNSYKIPIKKYEKYYSTIDSKEKVIKEVKRFMDDKDIYFEYPHYYNLANKNSFKIHMYNKKFSSCKSLHRGCFYFYGEEKRNFLNKNNISSVDAIQDWYGWYKAELISEKLKNIYNFYDKINNLLNEDIHLKEYIKVDGYNDLSFIPASHLKTNMNIPIINKKGKICLDRIIKINCEYFEGYVNDIDVEEHHNYFANGILSHNSIYGFRGARHQNIRDFVDIYDNCKVISLSKNYRSTPQIINVAEKLIKNNENCFDTKFETDNSDGESVVCISVDNQFQEAQLVGRHIRKLIEVGGWTAKDMAVLYRANRMSEPIEQALVNNGIPYEVIGTWNFYNRKEVKDCIAMLKFLLNHNDGIAFHRICSMLRGVGDTTINKIEQLAEQNNINIVEACKVNVDKSRYVNTRKACKKIVDVFSQVFNYDKPATSLYRMIKSFDFEEYLSKKYSYGEAQERIDNVKQMIESANAYEGVEKGCEKYLQQVALTTSNDKEVKENKVSLMTLHASKGLEFPVVFMIGVEDGILPHKQSLNVPNAVEAKEEERRLCYVGVTRAKKLLYITWCKRRRKFSKFGKINFQKSHPSIFLREMELFNY